MLLYHPLIGKTVLGFGAKKTPAYVTHILTTKQHSCCCQKLPMSSHEEEDLLRPNPSGGYSTTLLWNVHRQQGDTTVVGDAQIICSYGPRTNKYEHFPMTYPARRRKKTHMVENPDPNHTERRLGNCCGTPSG